LYYDRCGDLWYEHEVMCESRLPALIHELHRPRPLTTTVPIASQSAPNVAPYAHQASSLSSAAIHQQHPTSFGMAAAAAAAGLSAAHQPTQLLQSLPVTAHRHQSSLMPNESSLLGTTAQNTILSSNIPIGANSAISQSSMVPSSLRGDMRGSCMLSAQSMTLSGQHEQHQQRERMMKTIPQTGVTSGSPYLDTSNLLRPATPSRIPNSVDDAIDSVRKSAQKSSSSFGSMSRSYGGSSRSLFSDGRSIKSDLRRPLTPPPRENEAIDYEGPEWLITEDFALILAVAHEQHFSYHLNSAKPGHTINWDFVSRLMMRYTSFYRSPRQCSIHYQLVVQPREEGRTMALDPVTKKSRKVPVSSVELSEDSCALVVISYN
uniref:EP400 protein n=1 Tax=Anisakis simplex TaxID=6269 RepID=A0A0M3KEZ9_ANISI